MVKKAAKEEMPTSRVGTWNRGYTLIELSIILILLGVILLFALPKLDSIGDVRLRSTARELAGTIQSLFDESILKRTPYQLVFNIGERTYSIVETGVNPESSEVIETIKKEAALPDKTYIKDIVTPIDGKAAEGKIVIRFYPDGFVDKSVIHLSNGKKDYTLVTTPLSGKVKILEGYVEIQEGG
jgi:prepilin-type N-terminal cleavage/methylation domain-containing protein